MQVALPVAKAWYVKFGRNRVHVILVKVLRLYEKGVARNCSISSAGYEVGTAGSNS